MEKSPGKPKRETEIGRWFYVNLAQVKEKNDVRCFEND